MVNLLIVPILCFPSVIIKHNKRTSVLHLVGQQHRAQMQRHLVSTQLCDVKFNYLDFNNVQRCS